VDAWTPDATLEFVRGLWGLGLGAVGLFSFCWFWYVACRYGWPWRKKDK
jgi:hypothetical protein